MNWLQIPSAIEGQPPVVGSEALAAELEQRVAQKIGAGKYRAEDVRYVKDVTFMPLAEDLKVSSLRLEKLRRLCQLWEVDLKAPREIRSHRKLVGPMIVAAKRMFFPVLRIFFKETLRQQRDFNAAAIALLADLSNEKNEK